MTVTALPTRPTAEDTARTVATALAEEHNLPVRDLTVGSLNGQPLAFIDVGGFLDLRRWAGVLKANYRRGTSCGYTWFALRAEHEGVVFHLSTQHRPIRIGAVS